MGPRTTSPCAVIGPDTIMSIEEVGGAETRPKLGEVLTDHGAGADGAVPGCLPSSLDAAGPLAAHPSGTSRATTRLARGNRRVGPLALTTKRWASTDVCRFNVASAVPCISRSGKLAASAGVAAGIASVASPTASAAANVSARVQRRASTTVITLSPEMVFARCRRDLSCGLA